LPTYLPTYLQVQARQSDGQYFLLHKNSLQMVLGDAVAAFWLSVPDIKIMGCSLTLV
jgi:hypothetical protein